MTYILYTLCAVWALMILAAAGLVFSPSFRAWFFLKRVCAWCKPKRWIGGNPLARRTSDGICPRCRANWLARSALKTP